MNNIKDKLLVYAVTDRAWVGEKTLLEQIEEALQGGVTILQLREKELPDEQFLEEALQVKAICERYHVPLIINDRVDIALQAGAQGVHVGIEDTPVAQIRQQAGPEFIIGATAKTVEQAKLAYKSGADYLGVGAVFPSGTKTSAIRITKEQLQEICESVPIPTVAIGGITLENLQEIQGRGMDGVAVVSAIFGAKDIRAAAAALKQQMEAR